MTLALSYNDDLSRVQISLEAESSPSESSPSDNTQPSYATVERSTNGVLFETVRGGVEVSMDGEEFASTVDDYEFRSDAQNTYRVRTYDENDSLLDEFTDSITPSLGGRIWLKHIRYPALNRKVTVSNFGDPERASRGGAFGVAGRANPVGVTDIRGSRAFVLELLTEDLDEARNMDLVLAVGGIYFVHLPADCPVPGGYVLIGDTTEQRRSTRGKKRYFELPCRVVTPPGPEVVGTTLTWNTVLDIFGSSTALLNTYPTWADLFDLMSSPDDVVDL